MSSSTPLTLWAFLGFESAAQNSIAVEDPKRNVQLACIFGMLIASVIYILGTTVIQGIVKNANLAKSTAPFGLAYTTMFNSTVGDIIMVLAAMACIVSLLAWQFTWGQIGKAAADRRMTLAFFSMNLLRHAGHRHDDPCRRAIGDGPDLDFPSLTAQFNAVVNLAVVTNVVPYVLALSGMLVIMRVANTSPASYRSDACGSAHRDALQPYTQSTLAARPQ